MTPLGHACLLLAGCSLISCVNHDPATSNSEGAAHLTIVDVGGAVETFDIVTPDGDVYVRLEDWGDHCELSVNATTPVLSDLTSGAEARRVQMIVRVRDTEMPDLLAGKAQAVTPHAGLFAGDCSVDLERNRGSASVYDQWCSTGGTLSIDALPAVGGTFRMALSGVALTPSGGSETQEPRTLDGTVEAKLLATTRIHGEDAGTSCPR